MIMKTRVTRAVIINKSTTECDGISCIPLHLSHWKMCHMLQVGRREEIYIIHVVVCRGKRVTVSSWFDSLVPSAEEERLVHIDALPVN